MPSSVLLHSVFLTGKFLRQCHLFGCREFSKGIPAYIFLHQSWSLSAQRNKLNLKSASDNLRDWQANISALLKELMGPFRLDKKIEIWISFPFRWLLESPEAKLDAHKKAAYSKQAAKISLENIAWLIWGVLCCIPVPIVLKMIILIREKAKQGL